ncbi:MAG TPA: PepSY domain-containing protein [Croceibacterium sp.]|nr:PepSY domain-containing protein [Croceibacterium sp.]
MALPRTMQRFARWHIWLGWVVGLPVLMWAVTGLWMAAQPLEDVRGEHLRAAPAAIDPAGLVFPQRIGEPIRDARLVAQPDGPAWIVTAADGRRWRYSARFGTATPPVVEDEAGRIAEAAYAGSARLAGVTYFAPGDAPADARASGAVWQARFADGARVYIDDATGEVVALRTGQWRLYDFLYGLHIMDPQAHEDAHNPFAIGFAALAVAGALLGCVLLFRRRKARVTA